MCVCVCVFAFEPVKVMKLDDVKYDIQYEDLFTARDGPSGPLSLSCFLCVGMFVFVLSLMSWFSFVCEVSRPKSPDNTTHGS